MTTIPFAPASVTMPAETRRKCSPEALGAGTWSIRFLADDDAPTAAWIDDIDPGVWVDDMTAAEVSVGLTSPGDIPQITVAPATWDGDDDADPIVVTGVVMSVATSPTDDAVGRIVAVLMADEPITIDRDEPISFEMLGPIRFLGLAVTP